MTLNPFLPGNAGSGLQLTLADITATHLISRLPDPELAYWFQHVLVQESTYATLLKHDRMALHLRVAESIEQSEQADLDHSAALLAYHYGQAQVPAKCLEYALRAGDLAARLYANAEATAQYEQALRALDELPVTPESERTRMDTVIKLLDVAWGAGTTAEHTAMLEGLIEPARTLADTSGDVQDRVRAARLRLGRGSAHFAKNDIGSAIADFTDLLDLPDIPNPPPDLAALPAVTIGGVLTMQGNFVGALPLLERGLAAAEATPDRWYWYAALAYLGMTQQAFGARGAARDYVARGLARARETANQTALAMMLIIRTVLAWMERDANASRNTARAAYQTAVHSGDAVYEYMGHGFAALAAAELGLESEARGQLAEARRIQAALGGNIFFSDWAGAIYAETELRLGDTAQAMQIARTTIDYAPSIGGIVAEGLARRTLGEILALQNSLDLAAAEFQNSLDLFDAGGASVEMAYTHQLWGDSFAAHGETATAQAHYTQAAAQFQALGLEHEAAAARTQANSQPVQEPAGS